MAEKVETIKDVTFQYKVSGNYALYSIDGVHGGLNATGDIIINFFSERQPIPRREAYKIKEDGALDPKPIEIEGTSDVIRNINFGIAVKPSVARSIANWLIEKADTYDKIMKDSRKKGKKGKKGKKP